eukprot:TRINITY_DN15254_c0_g1_i1.p1 TRINITY_DN15254_c0_g1~~TRINITY_DN15254_c0_g1_i1.p1  ORF type:complete len:976 (+),score=216.41 TRINITY_DN15254_c0_g1_i1:214-2928(+)
MANIASITDLLAVITSLLRIPIRQNLQGEFQQWLSNHVLDDAKLIEMKEPPDGFISLSVNEFIFQILTDDTGRIAAITVDNDALQPPLETLNEVLTISQLSLSEVLSNMFEILYTHNLIKKKTPPPPPIYTPEVDSEIDQHPINFEEQDFQVLMALYDTGISAQWVDKNLAHWKFLFKNFPPNSQIDKDLETYVQCYYKGDKRRKCIEIELLLDKNFPFTSPSLRLISPRFTPLVDDSNLLHPSTFVPLNVSCSLEDDTTDQPKNDMAEDSKEPPESTLKMLKMARVLKQVKSRLESLRVDIEGSSPDHCLPTRRGFWRKYKAMAIDPDFYPFDVATGGKIFLPPSALAAITQYSNDDRHILGEKFARENRLRDSSGDVEMTENNCETSSSEPKEVLSSETSTTESTSVQPGDPLTVTEHVNSSQTETSQSDQPRNEVHIPNVENSMTDVKEEKRDGDSTEKATETTVSETGHVAENETNESAATKSSADGTPSVSHESGDADVRSDLDFGEPPYKTSVSSELDEDEEIQDDLDRESLSDSAFKARPMTFEISTQKGKRSFTGVLEFTADEGCVLFPRWILQNLTLPEGTEVEVREVILPKGTGLCLQPRDENFKEVSDPKKLLEWIFPNHAALTPGDVVVVHENKKPYLLSVLSVQPGRAISLFDSDISLDLAPPLHQTHTNNTATTTTTTTTNTHTKTDDAVGKILGVHDDKESSQVEGVDYNVCPNCKHRVPPPQFALHTARCARNNWLCDSCGEVVLRSDREKHLAEVHGPTPCSECSQLIEKWKLARHKMESCPHRLVTCRYCGLGTHARDIEEHQRRCGDMTQICESCGVRIRKKESEIHSKLCFGQHGGSLTTSGEIQLCTECGFPFETLTDLETHIKSVHPHLLDSLVDTSSDMKL